jgi:hypothetical protein
VAEAGVRHVDAQRRFALAVPEEWEQVAEQDVHTPFVAVEPGDDGGFRANVVVSVDDVGTMTLRDWQAGNDRLLPSVLRGYLLIDLELTQVAGRHGLRRLAHHTTQDNRALCMQQWATLAEGVGYTLTLTVPTLRFAALAETVDDVVASFHLGPLDDPS